MSAQPPATIDPNKDFFQELSRYAVELVRYRAAVEEELKEEFGPWPWEPEREVRRRYLPSELSEPSYDDRRAYFARYGYF